jgi:hypothetical protein
MRGKLLDLSFISDGLHDVLPYFCHESLCHLSWGVILPIGTEFLMTNVKTPSLKVREHGPIRSAMA